MRLTLARVRRSLALAFVALAGLEGPAAMAQDAKPPEDLLAEARPAIEAANSDWVPAMKRKDAKAIAAAYAPNGVFVAPVTIWKRSDAGVWQIIRNLAL